MAKNPFTPIFGGKPDLFFGRKEILRRFDRALSDRGSEDRALFITGTRGSGKTALIEQLSLKARRAGWLTIDLGPEGALRALVRRLAGHDEITRTTDPQVSVNVLGSGASIGGVSTSKVKRVDDSDLDLLLIAACSRERKGVMVTIDEVQKLPKHDISAISNAFQMASRKGCDAIIAIAGLPYAYEEVISYPGCTFMRRAVHERVGLLTGDEVSDAFTYAVGKKAGLEMDDGCLQALVSASYGHPYMMQLLGYYLVDGAAQWEAQGDTPGARLSREDAERAAREALDAYRSRALRPMVAELSTSELAFLTAMAKTLGPDRTAPVSQVADSIGKTTKQVSMVRRSLLRSGIVIAPARGELMFTVPYLADYLSHGADETDEAKLYRAWRV